MFSFSIAISLVGSRSNLRVRKLEDCPAGPRHDSLRVFHLGNFLGIFSITFHLASVTIGVGVVLLPHRAMRHSRDETRKEFLNHEFIDQNDLRCVC